MKLGKKQLEEAIFGRIGFQRFTQDSPVLPDVWLAFGNRLYLVVGQKKVIG